MFTHNIKIINVAMVTLHNTHILLYFIAHFFKVATDETYQFLLVAVALQHYLLGLPVKVLQISVPLFYT